ncbi:hypothetical protein [Achromobacter anxifer]|uniref:hypothetical protein n=1 Tax=Achromobacter anxifer TaxID=1287737 RepID=UPI0023F714A0|nr:hypothetical protein [Achromobacter anxifer]MDF8364697.1 hypothetical protein [Achromobacter anxifer]
MNQSELAFDAGAPGVFLISHNQHDAQLAPLGCELKERHPDKFVGVNHLGLSAIDSFTALLRSGLDGMWTDRPGVDSRGVQNKQLFELAREHPALSVFASVAFKYQAADENPPQAARHALTAGYLPTTSGSATGVAAPLEKVKFMSAATGGRLAIASGMTAANISVLGPYLSHILVATGVSTDEYHFDYELLRQFLGLAAQVSIDG